MYLLDVCIIITSQLLLKRLRFKCIMKVVIIILAILMMSTFGYSFILENNTSVLLQTSYENNPGLYPSTTKIYQDLPEWTYIFYDDADFTQSAYDPLED